MPITEHILLKNVTYSSIYDYVQLSFYFRAGGTCGMPLFVKYRMTVITENTIVR